MHKPQIDIDKILKFTQCCGQLKVFYNKHSDVYYCLIIQHFGSGVYKFCHLTSGEKSSYSVCIDFHKVKIGDTAQCHTFKEAYKDFKQILNAALSNYFIITKDNELDDLTYNFFKILRSHGHSKIKLSTLFEPYPINELSKITANNKPTNPDNKTNPSTIAAGLTLIFAIIFSFNGDATPFFVLAIMTILNAISPYNLTSHTGNHAKSSANTSFFKKEDSKENIDDGLTTSSNPT